MGSNDLLEVATPWENGQSLKRKRMAHKGVGCLIYCEFHSSVGRHVLVWYFWLANVCSSLKESITHRVQSKVDPVCV